MRAAGLRCCGPIVSGDGLMTFVAKTLGLLAAGAALAGTPAMAQRDLDRSQNDIRAYEDRFDADGEAREFTFTIPANTRFTLDVMSAPGEGRDPVIELYDAATGDLVAQDDDSGGELNSRIELTARARTRYRLEVSEFAAFDEEGSDPGTFHILLRTRAFVPPPTTALQFGRSYDGDTRSSGEAYYTFTGQRDQPLDIVMTAVDNEFDTYLELYQGADTEGEMVGADDDGGEGVNSRLRLRLPADGTYTLVAKGFADSRGRYTLSAEEIAVTSSDGLVGLGDAVDGDLTFALSDGTGFGEYVEYRLTDQARAAAAASMGSLVIDLESDEIDPLVEVGFASPLGFSVASTNDDRDGSLDSRLVVDLAELNTAGSTWLETMRIRARSAVGDRGTFALRVRIDEDGSILAEEPREREYSAYAVDAVAEAAADVLEAEADAMDAEADQDDRPRPPPPVLIPAPRPPRN